MIAIKKSDIRCSYPKDACQDVREEIESLKTKLEKAIEAVKDFKDYGTKHDINPTGQFKECGCFDSFVGDNWQGYIRSQDESVRERARQTLKELE